MRDLNPAQADDPFDIITLADGSGGEQTHQLLNEIFLPLLESSDHPLHHDSGHWQANRERWCVSTDSYVVSPLEFPGGDIGRLCAIGTANDLAMGGAQPRYLSAGFIIEEGFKKARLKRLVGSFAKALQECGFTLLAADTKVVGRGQADGLFINTTGLGPALRDLNTESGNRRQSVLSPLPSPLCIEVGDVVVVSGDIGRHGTCLLAAREGLEFSSPLLSDCANLAPAVAALYAHLPNLQIHCLRDITRGGLATVLCELAEASRTDWVIDEANIPLNDSVRGACELFGLDPLHMACEGRMVVILPQAQAASCIQCLQEQSPENQPQIIGRVEALGSGTVHLRNPLGLKRYLARLPGSPLPRIC